MNTRTFTGVLMAALVALPVTAQDGGKQTQQGADAPRTKTDSGQPTQEDESLREQTKQASKPRLQRHYARAKEVEKKLDKARKKLEELKKFKEFVNPEALQQTEAEVKKAEEEFDGVIFLLGMDKEEPNAVPNDEAKTAVEDDAATIKAFKDACDHRDDYVRKRKEELKMAGKTNAEIDTELTERDPKMKEIDEEVRRLNDAFGKSVKEFPKTYYKALKKAEQEGKFVIEDKTNDKFKASSTPNSNEPQGGIKLGGNSYVPPADGTGGTGLKTIPLPNWDFSGTGQVVNPVMPPIIIPPYGGPGWEGASPMNPTIPGFMPTVPSGAATPQGSACGCSCKPTCTCKPVCNCKK